MGHSFSLFALPYTAMYMYTVSRGLCVYAWMKMGKDKSACTSLDGKGGLSMGHPFGISAPL